MVVAGAANPLAGAAGGNAPLPGMLPDKASPAATPGGPLSTATVLAADARASDVSIIGVGVMAGGSAGTSCCCWADAERASGAAAFSCTWASVELKAGSIWFFSTGMVEGCETWTGCGDTGESISRRSMPAGPSSATAEAGSEAGGGVWVSVMGVRQVGCDLAESHRTRGDDGRCATKELAT